MKKKETIIRTLYAYKITENMMGEIKIGTDQTMGCLIGVPLYDYTICLVILLATHWIE